MTFIDETDIVRYRNEGDATIFKRAPEVIGTKVQDCHSPKSLPKVEQVINDLKAGRRITAELVDIKGHKVSIRYFPVKDKNGKYIGTLEVTQDITDLQRIEGEKRLLDEG